MLNLLTLFTNFMIALIAAIAKNNCIGKDNQLPWHIPEDLEHFKKLTTGKVVLMGRKTWESIPEKFRPLPNRKNLVITRNTNYEIPKGMEIFNNTESALEKYKDQDVFVIGGAGIYKQTIDLADTLYITHVHKEVEGDAFFPEIDPEIWKEVEREDHEKFSFVTYKRL